METELDLNGPQTVAGNLEPILHNRFEAPMNHLAIMASDSIFGMLRAWGQGFCLAAELQLGAFCDEFAV